MTVTVMGGKAETEVPLYMGDTEISIEVTSADGSNNKVR